MTEFLSIFAAITAFFAGVLLGYRMGKDMGYGLGHKAGREASLFYTPSTETWHNLGDAYVVKDCTQAFERELAALESDDSHYTWANDSVGTTGCIYKIGSWPARCVFCGKFMKHPAT